MNASIKELAKTFTEKFKTKRPALRTIGREAEYPVIQENGQAGDVRKLWEVLLRQGNWETLYDNPKTKDLIVGLKRKDYCYSLEVGLGTVEVITEPRKSLLELKALHEEAMGPLLKAAKTLNYKILGYGVQPFEKPSLKLMSPKQRYGVLHQLIGEPWLLFAVTASDQVQVDITRGELLKMINFGNLMAPVVIAFCGNSPTESGRKSSFLSSREGLKEKIYEAENRHGMIQAPFESIEDFITVMSKKTCLMTQDAETKTLTPYAKTFDEYLSEKGPDFEAFLLHDHYIWNSARARAAHSTLEIRPSCQQPWNEHMASAALTLALIEACDEILDLVHSKLGTTYWDTFRKYQREAVRMGLEAEEPFDGMLKEILTLGRKALENRNQGEEILLDPLEARLSQKKNPAQVVRNLEPGQTLIDAIALPFTP